MEGNDQLLKLYNVYADRHLVKLYDMNEDKHLRQLVADEDGHLAKMGILQSLMGTKMGVLWRLIIGTWELSGD